MQSSKFDTDLENEAVVNRFLQENYYPLAYDSYEEETNIEKQKQGIDGRVSINGEQILIDEKAQLGHLHKPKPSFVLEQLSSTETNKHNELIHSAKGWWQKEMKTDAYIFVWFKEITTYKNDNIGGSNFVVCKTTRKEHTSLDEQYDFVKKVDDKTYTFRNTKENCNTWSEQIEVIPERVPESTQTTQTLFTTDNIHTVILAHVNVDKLEQELDEVYGLDKRKLLSDAKIVGRKQNGNTVRIENKNFQYYYSDNLAECPINLVVKTPIYEDVSGFVYEVTQEGIQEKETIDI